MQASKEMGIADLLALHPDAAQVLRSFGLPCDECIVASEETLEEGARRKGLDPEEVLARLRALLPPDGGSSSSSPADS